MYIAIIKSVYEKREKMDSFIFESIEHKEKSFAKVFTAFIDHSNFHWHYEYEFIFVLKGSLLISTGSRPMILETGDILLINTKEVHELQKTEEDNICLFVQLSPDLFEKVQDKHKNYHFYLNSNDGEMTPKKGCRPFIKLIANIAWEASREDVIGYYRTKSYIYMLIADLFDDVQYDIRQYAFSSKKTEKTENLMGIIRYVEEHFNDEILMNNLCHNFGMSEKTIYRFLKHNIGKTVKDLVIECKIRHSKTMLKYTDKSISYIANECGFISEATFYRVFREKVVITPKFYRSNGIAGTANPEVKGYLEYSKKEAMNLLKEYL